MKPKLSTFVWRWVRCQVFILLTTSASKDFGYGHIEILISAIEMTIATWLLYSLIAERTKETP